MIKFDLVYRCHFFRLFVVAKSMQVHFIHNSFRKHVSITCRRGAVGWWHLNHISHFACLPLKSQFTGNCVSRKVNAKFALKKSQHSYEKVYVIFTPHNFFFTLNHFNFILSFTWILALLITRTYMYHIRQNWLCIIW